MLTEARQSEITHFPKVGSMNAQSSITPGGPAIDWNSESTQAALATLETRDHIAFKLADIAIMSPQHDDNVPGQSYFLFFSFFCFSFFPAKNIFNVRFPEVCKVKHMKKKTQKNSIRANYG